MTRGKQATTQSNTEQIRKKFGFQEAGADEEVIQALFELAKSGKSSTAAIFWAKARCGMHDKGGKKERKADKVPTIVIRAEEKRA